MIEDVNLEGIAGERERLKLHIEGTIATKQRVAEQCADVILEAATVVARALASGRKILLCGNGGSAADCQHIAAELVSVLTQDFLRPGLPAIAMTTDSSILTASANDFGYAGIFERQTQALGCAGDVLIGISTSGRSENVTRAMRYANANGIATIALTGEAGADMAQLATVAIRVPSQCVQHIQEAHIMIGHIICDLAERAVFPALIPATVSALAVAG